jgi:hypothetical protein
LMTFRGIWVAYAKVLNSDCWCHNDGCNGLSEISAKPACISMFRSEMAGTTKPRMFPFNITCISKLHYYSLSYWKETRITFRLVECKDGGNSCKTQNKNSKGFALSAITSDCSCRLETCGGCRRYIGAIADSDNKTRRGR